MYHSPCIGFIWEMRCQVVVVHAFGTGDVFVMYLYACKVGAHMVANYQEIEGGSLLFGT